MAVLSFSETFYKKIKYQVFYQNDYSDTKSLQVPCTPLLIILNALRQSGKRVLPFIFQKRYEASMTIEAALVLPLFVFCSLALMMPMKWLDTERKIRMAAERFCEQASVSAYEQGGILSGLLLKGIAEQYADDVIITESSVSDITGDIRYELKYKRFIPFFRNMTKDMNQTIGVQRREWIGLDGKLKEKNGGREEDRQDEIVFVGAAMGRYHLYRDCHYISNTYQTITVKEASNRITSHGNKVTACSVCAKDCTEDDMVYLTPEGKHYHTSISCRSMSSYVQERYLEDVRHLGVCSYCAGRNAGAGTP